MSDRPDDEDPTLRDCALFRTAFCIGLAAAAALVLIIIMSKELIEWFQKS